MSPCQLGSKHNRKFSSISLTARSVMRTRAVRQRTQFRQILLICSGSGSGCVVEACYDATRFPLVRNVRKKLLGVSDLSVWPALPPVVQNRAEYIPALHTLCWLGCTTARFDTYLIPRDTKNTELLINVVHCIAIQYPCKTRHYLFWLL